MSYGQYESSVESAMPIRLYEFNLSSKAWRYNSSDKQVLTADGKLWLSAAIEDDGLKISGDDVSDTLTITCEPGVAPAQLFVLAPPSGNVRITIYEKHVGDDELYVQYVGEVTQVNYGSPPGSVQIRCATLSETMEREGLRMVWQRACTHTMYDASCRLDPLAHRVTAVVQAVNGTQVSVIGMPAGSNDFTGGYIEWEHPVKGTEWMAIEGQTENEIFTFGFPYEIHPGMAINVYRGCNLSPDACQAYGNYANYGGVPSLPGKSPFDGLQSPFF